MKSKYIIDGYKVIEVFEIDDYLVPCSVLFDKAEHQLYNSREDARYYSLLEQLDRGKSIEDFKSSRYYSYYLERLKRENEEYLI
jgi:hypothetical protein